jgi:predicted phosphoribosyltransferase
VFRDREDAGRRLAARLEHLRSQHPIILALPRGGVPVAAEIARALNAPLGLLPVRKIGAPEQRELGVGAIAGGGASVIDWGVVRELKITDESLQSVIEEERAELERQRRAFGAVSAEFELEDRCVVIVDDGLATGVSALAAIRAARDRGARRIILAVPVGAPDTVEFLRSQLDDVVCLVTPANFRAVGFWYSNFAQTSDTEVVGLLMAAKERVQAESDGCP